MFQNPINLLETTFQYLSLCGVCPNSLRDSLVPWTKKVVNSFFIILPIYHFVNIIVISYQFYLDIIAFVLVIGNILIWANFLVCMLNPLRSAGALVKFFQTLEQAQLSLSSLDIVQPPVPSRMLQRFYVWGCGVVPLFVSVALLAPNSSFYYTSVLVLRAVVIWGTLVKFKMMLLFIDLKFDILNEKLKEVCDRTEPYKPKDHLNIEDFISSQDYIKEETNINYKGITVDKILKFNKAHFQLSDAHQTVSEMFSSIGFTMTLAVSCECVRAFLISEDLPSTYIAIQFFGSAFLSMFLFISLMTSATNIKNNAMKTGYMIHELLSDEHAPDIEEELTLFSQLLFHRKLAISAEGFFVVDLKLVTKMVCMLTPLILIMIQQKHRKPRLARMQATAI